MAQTGLGQNSTGIPDFRFSSEKKRGVAAKASFFSFFSSVRVGPDKRKSKNDEPNYPNCRSATALQPEPTEGPPGIIRPGDAARAVSPARLRDLHRPPAGQPGTTRPPQTAVSRTSSLEQPLFGPA